MKLLLEEYARNTTPGHVPKGALFILQQPEISKKRIHIFYI
jgi:hypothetical protein